MTSQTTTYSFNLNNLKLVDKEVVSDWTELLCESDGSFTRDCQYMVFNCDGIEVSVDFSLSVHGSIFHESGDYWNPSYTEVDITDVDVTVEGFYVDEWEVELNKEMIKTLEMVVKSNL